MCWHLIKVVFHISGQHSSIADCDFLVYSYGWAATGSMDQKLIIWDLAHQSSRCTCEHDVSYLLCHQPFLRHLWMHLRSFAHSSARAFIQEGVTSLAWLGSSRYVASGCIDGKVRIWDSLSGDCAREFSGLADVVQSLAVTTDGNALVSVSTDGSARVFDISMFK